MMGQRTIVIANPDIVFREEFDDWAVLFNPDTGDGVGINPVGVYIWKHLDGRFTIGEIADKLKKACDDAPDDTEAFVTAFIDQLLDARCAGMKVG